MCVSSKSLQITVEVTRTAEGKPKRRRDGSEKPARDAAGFPLNYDGRPVFIVFVSSPLQTTFKTMWMMDPALVV